MDFVTLGVLLFSTKAIFVLFVRNSCCFYMPLRGRLLKLGNRQRNITKFGSCMLAIRCVQHYGLRAWFKLVIISELVVNVK